MLRSRIHLVREDRRLVASRTMAPASCKATLDGGGASPYLVDRAHIPPHIPSATNKMTPAIACVAQASREPSALRSHGPEGIQRLATLTQSYWHGRGPRAPRVFREAAELPDIVSLMMKGKRKGWSPFLVGARSALPSVLSRHNGEWALIRGVGTRPHSFRRLSSAMMELSLLNAYLAVLVVFELVEIKIKLWDGGKLNSFGRSLTNGSAERRLWSFMLALLAISRTVALCYPDDVVSGSIWRSCTSWNASTCPQRS